MNLTEGVREDEGKGRSFHAELTLHIRNVVRA